MINTKFEDINNEKDDEDEKLMKHYEPISEEERKSVQKEIEELKREKEKLNISEETRRKNKKDLTKKEYDKLYDEYVYDSLIESLESEIEYGLCDIKYLLEYMEKKYGVSSS